MINDNSITGFAACLDALSQTGQTPLIYDVTIGYHGYSVCLDYSYFVVGLVDCSPAHCTHFVVLAAPN